MPLILGLETSADVCAAALVADGEVLGVSRLDMSRGHAEALVPMVRDIAAVAGVELAALDLIGVTRGPGSFTGVRTGMAAARGFAIAADAPAIGVSSLQAVAYRAARDVTDAVPVLCVLDTRRADFFAQTFDDAGVETSPPRVIDADAVFGLIASLQPVLAGNAVSRLLSGYDGDPGRLRRAPGNGNPDPVDVAAIAETLFSETVRNKKELARDTLSPLYLRAPEAKRPVNGGRLKR